MSFKQGCPKNTETPQYIDWYTFKTTENKFCLISDGRLKCYILF